MAQNIRTLYSVVGCFRVTATAEWIHATVRPSAARVRMAGGAGGGVRQRPL